MPIKHSNAFSYFKKQCCDKPEHVANALKALGHPVRLQMIEELKGSERPCCGDICQCFPYSQSTISQHLSVLVDAGLVHCNQDGNKSRYSLNHSAFSQVLNTLVQYAADEETK